MKCGGAEDEKLQIQCPLCSQSRDDIHALKYHIKTAHKKNKRGKDQESDNIIKKYA